MLTHDNQTDPPADSQRQFPLGAARDLFDVPNEVAYFNTANMSPLLRSVREAGERGLQRRAAPWGVTPADWFTDVERLRGNYARILGTTPDAVALVPATSYGLAVAARNVQANPGDEVVVLAGEYPSNFYTWRRLCARTGAVMVVVDREPGQEWTEAVISRIGPRTRVVAVPNRALDQRCAARPRRDRRGVPFG